MPLATIEVAGRQKRWAVDWHASPGQIEAMRADGIDVGIVENIIPAWIARAGLTRPWCVLQDLWNFRSPWS